MASGDTKTQQYLDVAANGTRADVQHGCCETRTQSLIMDVADRIITEEETRAREDQTLQNEIDEIKNNPDVADIVPTYAALQDYDTSKLTDQDIIRVLADETHEGASTYYRWSTSSQTFTYVGETGDYYTKSQVNELLDDKQDLLTAGDGITIEEESGALVISSTGGGGGTSNFNQLTNRPKYNGVTMTGSTDIPEVKTYTAGTNISISAQNEISATDTTYTAGTGLDLTGTTFSADTTVLATKTDLDSKQDELTAGDNVTIEDESGALVISATDTTYSNFTGTDGTAAGTAGLVPAPATTDAGKFLKADGTWDTAGGGSGPTVVQTTGTSTTDVMSQNAATSMVFADPANRTRIQIGANASTDTAREIAIGDGATCSNYSRGIALGYASVTAGSQGIGIGSQAYCYRDGGVALGAYSGGNINANGMVDVGSRETFYGYNSSNYRLLTGLYDPQNAHDAANKEYVDPTTDSSAPTTATVGRLGQIFIDTTNADAYMCVAVDSVTPIYTWKKINA